MREQKTTTKNRTSNMLQPKLLSLSRKNAPTKLNFYWVKLIGKTTAHIDIRKCMFLWTPLYSTHINAYTRDIDIFSFENSDLVLTLEFESSSLLSSNSFRIRLFFLFLGSTNTVENWYCYINTSIANLKGTVNLFYIWSTDRLQLLISLL